MFTYKTPAYRGSTKKIEIHNEQNELVGYIERFYSNFFQKSLDFIFNSTFAINVHSYDANNSMVNKIKEEISINTLIKSRWTGTSNNFGNYIVEDKTKFKTNPRIEVTRSNGEKLLIKKDFADRRVIITGSSGEEVALITSNRLIPPREISIKLFSNEIPALETAALHLLFDIRD
ncbi:tubby C-terminal domain-like protein [Sporosarcina saromensis]